MNMPVQDFAGYVGSATFNTTAPYSGALSDSERHSLVMASKYPTAFRTPKNTPGARTVIQSRAWSNEFRIRTKVEPDSHLKPPEQAGPRITAKLSNRAARKIAESCSYVASEFGGYTTFSTLTFGKQQREKPQREETTIQREVSRYCDGLKKMYRRCWKAEFVRHGRRYFSAGKDGQPQGQPGHDTQFLYCWVAEVPTNDHGEPNPHVHMLLRWTVKYSLFPSWAKRIEELWGQGFAHLERIRDGEAASAYMMKAAGYLCKAQGRSDQGEIRGNRYGMSDAARAPDWVTLNEAELHVMGALIADVHDFHTKRYGAEFRERDRLRRNLDKTPKEKSGVRRAIRSWLAHVRERISKIPVVASKYQLIFKTREALDTFMAWAKSPGHWRAQCCDWLPEKGTRRELDTRSAPTIAMASKVRESPLLA